MFLHIVRGSIGDGENEDRAACDLVQDSSCDPLVERTAADTEHRRKLFMNASSRIDSAKPAADSERGDVPENKTLYAVYIGADFLSEDAVRATNPNFFSNHTTMHERTNEHDRITHAS
jgi:hypothetical protein